MRHRMHILSLRSIFSGMILVLNHHLSATTISFTDDKEFLAISREACRIESANTDYQLALARILGPGEYQVPLYSKSFDIVNGCVTNCREACNADLDQDGSADFNDLALLLGEWGIPSETIDSDSAQHDSAASPDLNHDGFVDIDDVAVLLGRWGSQ